MTIGIYSLYWEEPDLIYIGQSQNIERRWTEHLWLLKNNNHTNYKVQAAYNKYGTHSSNILEECSIDKLAELEIIYTDIFDSINNGLNIVEAGNNTYGTNSPNSKYSRFQILKVFSLLTRTLLSYIKISNRLNVNLSLVNDIAAGKSHLWLKEEYPSIYPLIKRNSILRRKYMNSSEKLNIEYPTILDPNGNEYSITSLRDFSVSITGIKNNINFKNGINRVLLGIRKSYLGWKLK